MRVFLAGGGIWSFAQIDDVATATAAAAHCGLARVAWLPEPQASR